jgi:hypothetical protein
VALVFLYVAVITLHGYKQFVPNYDLLQDTANARALLQKGWIPTHGSVSSFYAFNPPGVSWGMIPGLVIFPSEAALAEKTGSLLMLALTLAGLYWLLAGRFGATAAVLACMVFALSDRGFFFAGSLWPRAHPLFLVWFVYFVDRWMERQRYGLACGLTIWFAGAYWMMEGVTAILIVPLAWIAYRPPVRWREICFAIAAGALIWSPYFAFEARRELVDLRALLHRTSTRADFNADVRNSLSNQDLRLVENERPHKITGGAKEVKEAETHGSAPAYYWVFDDHLGWIYQAVNETVVGGVRGRWTFAQSLGGWVFRGPRGARSTIELKVGRTWKLIFASMPDTMVPGGAGVLAFLFASSVLWGFAGSIAAMWRKLIGGRWDWLPRALCWGFALVFGAGAMAAIYRGPPAFDLNHSENLSLATFCVLAFVAFWVPSFAFAKRFLPTLENPLGTKLQFLLTVTAFVPWIITILLMPGDNDDYPARRFLWLWVVQGALMVLFLRKLPGGRMVRGLALSGFIVLVTLNANGVGMAGSWYRNGFDSLPPGEFNNVVDFLGRRIKAEGRVSASIGYDVPFVKWMLAERVVDGVSKVGRQYDTVFRMRYGITNLDTNAEGVSRNDEFRIVEHSSQESWRQAYFDLSGYPEMTAIYTSPTYTVLGRSAGAKD